MEQVFYKYQGTGNDFILIDDRLLVFKNESISEIKLLCDRRFGIGGDGLIILRNKAEFDFEMIYYNADGNQSTMCGNGGRCMVRFAYDLGIIKNTCKFLAVDGEHIASIDIENSIVRLKMIDVNAVDIQTTYSVLDTGSPHYIKITSDVKNLNVENEGASIRNSELFKEDGINVNFLQQIENNAIYVRTFERGVEAETLSCGTGVTAAALVSATNIGFNKINVQTIGGSLSVEYNKINEHTFNEIYLCGPAVQVFKGTINN